MQVGCSVIEEFPSRDILNIVQLFYNYQCVREAQGSVGIFFFFESIRLSPEGSHRL